MRIGIIAMTRSGGRTLGQWLAMETGYDFMHEPSNNDIDINNNNDLIVKWLVIQSSSIDKEKFKIDKWVGLCRKDYKEAAVSHLRALEAKEWHVKYRVTDEWINENENKINELQEWMAWCNSELELIPDIELMVSYEGIYNTGEDIPKLLKYLNIENPKYLHYLDSSNRFRIKENNKKKSLFI